MIAPFLRQQTPVASILFTRVIVAGLEGEPWNSQDGYTVKSSLGVDKTSKFLWKEFNKKIFR